MVHDGITTVLTTDVCKQYTSVGIATRYGLDGPGIDFRWGEDFLHPGAHQPIQCVPGLSQG